LLKITEYIEEFHDDSVLNLLADKFVLKPIANFATEDSLGRATIGKFLESFSRTFGQVFDIKELRDVKVDDFKYEDMTDLKNREYYPLIQITHQGIKEIEQAKDNPKKPTEHYPPGIIKIIYNEGSKFQNINGSTIVKDAKVKDSFNKVE
jgi:hypothetical protein